MKPHLRLSRGVTGPLWVCTLRDQRYRFPAGLGRTPNAAYRDWLRVLKEWFCPESV